MTSQVGSYLVQDFLVARLFFLEPSPQRPVAHRKLGGDRIRVEAVQGQGGEDVGPHTLGETGATRDLRELICGVLLE
ncbi:MAG: hypothetical protein CL908_23865 [Deltaproteobacteria bacterium]|nr:hypothetical protein [Deltaproteobacteria bacterium]